MLPRKSGINNDLLPSTESSSNANQASKASSVSVLKSYEVNAFKCIDGKYELQGRHGIAILTNTEKTDFKLLLYGKGGKAVSQAIFHPVQNCITVPKHLYVTLLDAYNVYWSLLFDNEERFYEFICQVCIVRLYLSDGSHIVEQVLSDGDGESAELNDLVEMQFTGWIVEQSCIRGAVFESNTTSGATQKVKLGHTALIKGLNNALLRTKKNCTKIVAVPPALAYGKGGMPPKIPGSHPLLFLINVLRVKTYSKVRGDDEDSLLSDVIQSNNNDDDAPLPLLPSDDTESLKSSLSVKDRTRSISEKLEQPPSSSSKTKSDLLNRIVKMGQAVLTEEIVKHRESKTSVSMEDAIESEPASPVTPEKAPKPERKAPPAHQTAAAHAPQPVPFLGPQVMFPYPNMPPMDQTLMPYQSNPYPFYLQNPMATNLAPMGISPQPAAPVVKSETAKDGTSDLHLGMLVNETRQQNVEVRVVLARLEEKVEKLRDKVDESRQVAGGESTKYPSLESGMLLQNLTRIIRENEALKEEVYSKNIKLEEMGNRVSSLLQEKQMKLEEANSDIEKRSTVFKTTALESQTRVLALEEEKLRLAKDLSQRNNELYELQKGYDELRDSHRNLVALQEPLKREVETLKSQLIEVTESKIQWETSTNGLQKLLKAKEAELSHLNEKLNATEVKGYSLEATHTQRINQLEEDKRNLVEELETLRRDSLLKIDQLQRKSREDKSVAFESEAKLRNEIEEQCMLQWKKKCDDLVATESARKSRELREVQSEKQHLEEELTTLTERFDDFKAKTRVMKSQLLAQVTELQSQVDALTVELQDVRNSSELGAGDIAVKVKGVMNLVYQDVRKKFQPQKAYSGQVVMHSMLKVIRKTTLKMTENDTATQDSEEESEAEALDYFDRQKAASTGLVVESARASVSQVSPRNYTSHSQNHLDSDSSMANRTPEFAPPAPQLSVFSAIDRNFSPRISPDDGPASSVENVSGELRLEERREYTFEEEPQAMSSLINQEDVTVTSQSHGDVEKDEGDELQVEVTTYSKQETEEEVVVHAHEPVEDFSEEIHSHPAESDSTRVKDEDVIDLLEDIHLSQEPSEKNKGEDMPVEEKTEDVDILSDIENHEPASADVDHESPIAIESHEISTPSIEAAAQPEEESIAAASSEHNNILTNAPPAIPEVQDTSSSTTPERTTSKKPDDTTLFSDDDDQDFLKVIVKTNETKEKPAPSAMDSAPPPLFADSDDDDMSWLH